MSPYTTEDEEFIRARYQIDVLEAKQAHGLMLQTSYQNLIRAKMIYEKAKKEADELYLISRKKLFNRLRKELSNLRIGQGDQLELAERYNEYAERNGASLTRAEHDYGRTSASGVEQSASTGR